MTPELEQELTHCILAADSVADGAFEFVKANRAFVGNPEVERLILGDVGVALQYMASEKLTDWPELLEVIEAHPGKLDLRPIYFKIIYDQIEQQTVIAPQLRSRRKRKSDK